MRPLSGFPFCEGGGFSDLADRPASTTLTPMGLNIKHITYTRHFIKQARKKEFTAEQIMQALKQEDEGCKITRVTGRPDQLRYCGVGEDSVAVIMNGHRAITVYVNRKVTPMREDQRDDPNAINSRRLATLK